jgi:hypothetical protein
MRDERITAISIYRCGKSSRVTNSRPRCSPYPQFMGLNSVLSSTFAPAQVNQSLGCAGTGLPTRVDPKAGWRFFESPSRFRLLPEHDVFRLGFARRTPSHTMIPAKGFAQAENRYPLFGIML